MSPRSRPVLRVLPIVLALSCLGTPADDAKLVAETSLRPAPDSEERTAFLMPGTPIEVLEASEGWIRVRIEGWVPAGAVERASASGEPRRLVVKKYVPPAERPSDAPAAGPGLAPAVPPAPEPGVAPSVPVAPPAAATPVVPSAPADPPAAKPSAMPPPGVAVEGLVKVKLGRLKKRVAAGAPVMLVPAGTELGSETLPEDRLARLAELDAEDARLRREQAKVMKQSNFTRAMQERDALEDERRELLAERLDILAERHGRHEHAARAAAVSSGVTDAKGFFRLSAVPPGEYTLYVRMAREDNDLEWIEPVRVGAGPVRVDLDETNARGLLPKAE